MSDPDPPSHAIDEFNRKQPSYMRALFQPSCLRDYKPKNKSTPKWLDYWLYGPPAVRDSSPGGMAVIFGRTEHDKDYYPNGKSTLLRSFNGLFLICAYIFFLYVPYHMIYMDGIKPYREAMLGGTTDGAADCKVNGLLPNCPVGCVRSGLFGCKSA
eukprot:CAMPEP_0115861174 /NCGR_PEP_ID=MMETSP0287-20121206/17518_1 /TAXON_ID=412157 /ORGANISM="Chrysochromulina rotalis, Strain UIO044" /LENGTH=155 /DNA_ID=CAMNT_0003315543 /DNA_START=30 /DNA_END=497 /DNA_ORIENTATION=-